MLFKRILCTCVAFLLLSFPVLAEDSTSMFLVGDAQAWSFLNSNPPDRLGLLVRGLADQPITADQRSQFEARLEDGAQNGFDSALDRSYTLFTMMKLGMDPTDYRKANFLNGLCVDPALLGDSLDGASFALMIYRVSGKEISPTVRNSPAVVIDHILSFQQRDGGFSASVSHQSDVGATARALMGLSGYTDQPQVTPSIQKAIGWLSAQQNSNGTFSVNGQQSSTTTAWVTLAVSMCGIPESDARFQKDQGNLSDALTLFRHSDGGYKATNNDVSAQVFATELALIADYARKTSQNPFTPSSPAERPIDPKREAIMTYLKFVIGFFLIFGIVYLLLLITIKVGKIAEQKKLPGSLAAAAEKEKKNAPSPVADEHTMEIHIPMSAKIPDFEQVSERESGMGGCYRSLEEQKKSKQPFE